MGWPTKYTGPEIDEALEKGRNLRVVNNGWIRLNSSSASPTNLGDLKNPGNYVTSFWADGPNLGDTIVSPLNVTIVSLNDDIYQFVDVAGKKYSRVMNSGESIYGNWEIDQTSGAINPGPTSPSNPVNGKTVWMDTSNASAPTLKLYINGEWREVIPAGAMQTSIYDPQGKRTDIFKYIDDAIEAASIGDVGIDFNEHINDTSIHVTESEKNKWNNSASKNDLTNAVNNLQTNLDTTIQTSVEGDIALIDELSATANTLKSSVDTHTANNSIHPTSSKQAEWDSKADGTHNHLLDGRVTVDVDHISGEIPSNMLPYDVKERPYIVHSLEEMYALVKNPIHNGDAICVETESESNWYFVIDDDYLGNTEIDEWTEGTISSTDRIWYSVCYGKDKFVAVAYQSNIFAYSTDGIIWTEVTVGSKSRDWRSVCYGNDKYVAVGNNSNISNIFAYSTDGITWTEVTVGSTNRYWYSVCYGNGKYVAISDDSIFVYSTDGITWTEVTVGETSRDWWSVCYGNGKYVAVAAESSIFAYSTDGITWTEVTVGSTDRRWTSVCYGNGKYVAVAAESSIFAYSTDGITWTEDTISDTSRDWLSVCYGNGKFVAVAFDSNIFTSKIFAYSTDGITWTEGNISDTSRAWYSVCYGNDKFVAVVYGSNVFAYSSLLPKCIKAFKKFSAGGELEWSSILNTPTTLSGYGITDGASKSEVSKIQTDLTAVQENIPASVDLSNAVDAQTSYNSAVENLNALDAALTGIEDVIIKLEAIAT